MRDVNVAENAASVPWISRATRALILMALAAISSGCARTGPDLVEQGRLTVERRPSRYARVSWVEVREGEQGAIMTGSVRPVGPASSGRKGHVHVTLVGPDKEAVRSICSEPIWLRQRRPGRGPKSRHFRVKLDAAPPRGGEALVGYLPGECAGAGT